MRQLLGSITKVTPRRPCHLPKFVVGSLLATNDFQRRLPTEKVRVHVGNRIRHFGHITAVPTTPEPLSKPGFRCRLEPETMAAESSTRKDNMKVEKVSLLVLTLCIAVLVYLLVCRPF
jgi:hypothetical protein